MDDRIKNFLLTIVNERTKNLLLEIEAKGLMPEFLCELPIRIAKHIAKRIVGGAYHAALIIIVLDYFDVWPVHMWIDKL